MDRLFNKGKDAAPKDTIQRIITILSEINIEVKHYLIDTNVENCFSSHVYIDGILKDFIGSNGKGTSEEFCLASGYAELIERIQNMIFTFGVHYLDTEIKEKIESMMKSPKFCSMDEQFEDEGSYLYKLLEQVAGGIKDTPEWLKMQVAKEQMKITFSYFEDRFTMVPFYHVNKKQYAWMPEAVIKFFVKSNGMASGNTLEEALVQGYSEIFERVAQKEILINKITPPRLPEHVINRYPFVKNVIINIQKSGRYKVMVYDCSLGRKLPVVCGIIVDTKKQRYGVRFGAHPDMCIALERVFTESLQGKNLETFTNFNSTTFSDHEENSGNNIFNTMKNGIGYYPASIFGSKPSYEFTEWDWNVEGGNKALTNRMSEKLQEGGYDIYIKDASFLGFPSVWIVVPGLSELCFPTMQYLKEIRLRLNVMDHMIHLHQIDDKKAEKIILCAKVLRYSVLENNISCMYALPFMKKAHGGSNEMDFLIAVTYYYLGNIEEAYHYMNLCRSSISGDHEEYCYVLLAEKYLLGIKNGYAPEVILDYLKAVSSEAVYHQVMNDFQSRQEILTKLYPHFNDFSEVRNNHKESCYSELCDFYDKIYMARIRNDVTREHLHKIFENNQ